MNAPATQSHRRQSSEGCLLGPRDNQARNKQLANEGSGITYSRLGLFSGACQGSLVEPAPPGVAAVYTSRLVVSTPVGALEGFHGKGFHGNGFVRTGFVRMGFAGTRFVGQGFCGKVFRGKGFRGKAFRGKGFRRGSLVKGSTAKGSLAKGSLVWGSLVKGSVVLGSLAKGSPHLGSTLGPVFCRRRGRLV